MERRRTFVITGVSEGDHYADGTEFCLSIGTVRPSDGGKVVKLGSGSQAGDIHYDDVWLREPTLVEIKPMLEDHELRDLQVQDPLWAARGLRQALMALAYNDDVRNLIVEKGAGEMLLGLDDILALTYDLTTYDPPVIEEEQ